MAKHMNRSKGTCCFFPLDDCQSLVLTGLGQLARRGPGVVTASLCEPVQLTLFVAKDFLAHWGLWRQRLPNGQGSLWRRTMSAAESARWPPLCPAATHQQPSYCSCGSTTRSNWTRCLSSCACSGANQVYEQAQEVRHLVHLLRVVKLQNSKRSAGCFWHR